MLSGVRDVDRPDEDDHRRPPGDGAGGGIPRLDDGYDDGYDYDDDDDDCPRRGDEDDDNNGRPPIPIPMQQSINW